MEDEIRAELEVGSATPPRLMLVGTEPLLALHLPQLLGEIGRRFPSLAVDVRSTRDDDETERLLREGPPTLAIVGKELRGAVTRPLPPASFGTFIGSDHPLSPRASRGVPVVEVVTHAFVVPSRPVFGPMAEGASTDGWRDDAFPRRHRRTVPTLALTAAYVEAGHAVAYLPRKLAERMDVCPLKVLECPYRCTVEAHVVRARTSPGWVRQWV